MMGTKKADQKQVRKAAEAAINVFPKAAIVADLTNIANATQAVGNATAEGASHSLELMRHAEAYSNEAHEVCNGDTSTVLKDWRENVRLVALELAAAGSPFAESKDTENGTTAKLTGTGNNVMSIAKGVVDFRLSIDDCTNDDGEVSYRSVRATVEAKRAERRAEADPDAAALAAAKEDCREAWKDLSKLVFSSDDRELIETLTATLVEMAATEREAQAEQDAAEVEAA